MSGTEIQRFDSGFLPVNETISYSGAGASGERRIYFPRVPASEVLVAVRYTETDSGATAAGETFEGYTDYLKIVGVKGNQEWDLMHAKTDELTKLCKILSGSSGAGRYADDQPTENTEQHAYYNFVLPEDYTVFDSVYLAFASRAVTSEFGSGTGMTVRMSVTLKVDNRVKGINMVCKRFTSPTSSTLHTGISVSDDVTIGSIFFQLAAEAPKNVTVTAESGVLSPKFSGDFQCAVGAFAYQEHIETAAADPPVFTYNLYPGLNMAGKTKTLEIETTAATTISLGFVIGTLNRR